MQKLAIEYLLRTKDRYPDNIALVEGNSNITYADLWLRVMALSRLIRSSVQGAPQPIVVSIEKSIDAVIAILAVQLSGHIYVPFDTKNPPNRRKAIFQLLGDPPVLEKRENGFHINEVSGGMSIPDVKSGDASRLEAELLRGLSAVNNIDPLYIIFTSGTTGIPKGVTISHAAVIDYIDWVVKTYQITEREIIASQAPLYFDNSVLDLYATFATGCTLHLIAKEKFVFLSDLVDYFEEQKVNLIFFVPSVLASIAALDLLAGRQLASLRKVLFCGEPMPLNTLKYLREKLPHALLSNLYGPTETTVDVIYWIFGDELDHLDNVPLGRPCENTRIIFLDDDNRPVSDDDVVAEICVSGVGVALGYWNDPEKTAAAFIQNPEQSHFRQVIYKTGDYGYRSSKDGLIYFLGRKDHQIKHLGHRIELGEIEAAMNKIGEVQQSCAVYDSATKRIVVFYVSSSNGEPQQLHKRLSDMLPPYMLPHVFHRLECFPVTANSKIDRSQLMQMLA